MTNTPTPAQPPSSPNTSCAGEPQTPRTDTLAREIRDNIESEWSDSALDVIWKVVGAAGQLERELTALHQQNAELQEQLLEAEQRALGMEELQDQFDALRAQLERAEKYFAETLAELSTKTKELEEARTQLAQAQADAEKYRQSQIGWKSSTQPQTDKAG